MHQKKYEEALEICNRAIFRNNELIQRQKKKILNNFYQSGAMVKGELHSELLYELCSKLYHNKLTLNTIEATQLNYFEKTILLCAFFDKNKLKSGVQNIKKWMSMMDFDENQRKILKQCLIRLQRNSGFFDIGFYNEILFGTEIVLFKEENPFLEQIGRASCRERV